MAKKKKKKKKKNFNQYEIWNNHLLFSLENIYKTNKSRHDSRVTTSDKKFIS
jgi:hypothetical protein